MTAVQLSPNELINLTHEYVDHFVAYREKRTLDSVRHRVNDWLRFGSMEVSAASLDAFRRTRFESGQSSATIESTIAAVYTVLRFHNITIDVGHKMRLPPPQTKVPTTTQIGKLYQHVGVASWPCKLRAAKRAAWWQAFIVVATWTAYRLGDVESLSWSCVDDTGVGIVARKTKRFRRPRTLIPMTTLLARHLQPLHRLFDDSVFGLRTQRKQLRISLAAIATAAGVDYVSPQAMRQFSISQWSAADSLAGRIVHGSAVGVMSHYVDQARHLALVAPRVVMPREFLADFDRESQVAQEREMLAMFRAATPDSRQVMIKIARGLA